MVVAFAVIFAIAVVFSSKLIGPQRPTPEKLSTYESGMKPVGSTHERVSVKYYLVAMLFIIFDLEVIFISGYSEDQLGAQGKLGEGIHLLRKPFNAAELLATIARVKGAHGAP